MGLSQFPRSVFCYGGCLKGPSKTLRQLHCIVIRPKMNEEHSRLLGEHVTVDRGDLDAVLSQHSDQRIHFVAGHEKVACDSGLAAVGRLEADRVRASHCGDDRHSVFCGRLPPRHGKLIDAAVGLPLESNDLIELRRVEIDRRHWWLRRWRRIEWSIAL